MTLYWCVLIQLQRADPSECKFYLHFHPCLRTLLFHAHAKKKDACELEALTSFVVWILAFFLYASLCPISFVAHIWNEPPCEHSLLHIHTRRYLFPAFFPPASHAQQKELVCFAEVDKMVMLRKLPGWHLQRQMFCTVCQKDTTINQYSHLPG